MTILYEKKKQQISKNKEKKVERKGKNMCRCLTVYYPILWHQVSV